MWLSSPRSCAVRRGFPLCALEHEIELYTRPAESANQIPCELHHTPRSPQSRGSQGSDFRSAPRGAHLGLPGSGRRDQAGSPCRTHRLGSFDREQPGGASRVCLGCCPAQVSCCRAQVSCVSERLGRKTHGAPQRWNSSRDRVTMAASKSGVSIPALPASLSR